MNFGLGILIYVLIFFILLYVFSKHGMGLFSALSITALISGIVLLAIIPPSEIEHEIKIYFSDKPHKKADDWIVLVYLLIMTLSLLLVSAYVIFKAFEDRQRRVHTLGDDYLCDFNDYLRFW